MRNKWFMSIVAVLGSLCLGIGLAMAEENKPVSIEGGSNVKTELRTATLGGGCFWCMEAVFQRIIGVESVESGYAGGSIPNPSYKDVSHGNSGHAEVIRIQFDPKLLSYKELLEIFFHAHNPTTLNKQGADEGTQYRSVIFYDGDEQKKDAEAVIKEITEKKLWDNPIVTEVSPISNYSKAEAYHQNYYNQNQSQPYCSIVIAPKLKKIYKEFAGRLKPVK